MYELTPAQKELGEDVQDALQIAHTLIDMGVPLFSAPPRTGSPGEFHYPDAWQTYRPNHVQVNRWKPGWCLAMVTGVVFDVMDIDPRNGGAESMTELAVALGWDDGPGGATVYGQAATPSAGEHLLIGRTYLAKTTKAGKGIDLQCGDRHGNGRGFVFIAPTVRPSKYGEHKGEDVAYRWRMAPGRYRIPGQEPDPGLSALVAHVQALQAPRRPTGILGMPSSGVTDDDDPFDGGVEAWTPESANRVISGQIEAVARATAGAINSTLGGAARLLGRFVGGGYLAEDDAAEMLLTALANGGVHSDSWNAANGLKWTAASVVATGLATGALEAWKVSIGIPGAVQGAEP